MKTIYASFLLIFAVWVTTLHAQTVKVVYDNSTTFVVPAGVTTIKASLWGAGARSSSTAGGGGGAYASTTFTNMVPGSSHAITIGSGTSFSGNKSTIFNNLTANGTSGSSGASATTGAGIISYPGGNGAVGSSGGGGAAAGTVNAGQSASGGINGVGINGGGSGGGGNPGGGGKQAVFGVGLGGNGRAILEWTCPASGSISYTNPTMFLGGTVQNVNYAGIGSGGTFSASPSGLSINAATGAIDPANSSIGTYTVTYTIAAAGACSQYSTSTSVTIAPIYVRAAATGANNGTSWANAFTSLESALATARTISGNVQIWVAGGTYKPSAMPINCTNCGTDPRNYTFHLPNNAQIYGGFAGTETTLAQRGRTTNSILNGDIGTLNNPLDNIYHVVMAVTPGTNLVLDGFVVVNGNANGTGSITLTPNISYDISQYRGGGMVIQSSGVKVNNVVFRDNNATTGGGIWANQQTPGTTTGPTITNCIMYANSADVGGGAYFINSFASMSNCAIVSNSAGSGVGGVYHQGAGSYITNSIIHRNFPSQLVNSVLGAVNFCIVEGGATGSNNQNVDPNLINGLDPDGPDNIWMTPDDGLNVKACSPAIDAGNNGSVSTTTDIANQPRLFNVPYIANNAVDIGPYENQSALTLTTIGSSHVVPNPQENLNDLVGSNLTLPDQSFSVAWQRSTDGGMNWQTIAEATSVWYSLPNLTQNTDYRRIITCISPNTSNVVNIKVVVPNGVISGKVKSINNTGVAGIRVCIQKTNSLPGSPQSFQRCDTTDSQGNYEFQNVFYGDIDQSVVGTTNFVITPIKAGHKFHPVTITNSLSSTIPQRINQDFTDSTVYIVSGKVFQQMTNAGENSNLTLEEALDEVSMFRNNAFIGVKTGFLNPPGAYGRYAVSVENPGTYKIEPRLTGHTFVPVFTNVNVVADVPNINFQDTTTRVISGRLTAGCNEFVGTAVLEFTAVLPNDAMGNPRTSQFKKRITTAGATGIYSIRLPARKYRVAVISVTPAVASNHPDYINPLTIRDFINALPADSLTRDIDQTNQVLNLTYVRPPVLQVIGFDDIACTVSTPSPFSIVQQGIKKPFSVKVWQGMPAKNCPARGDTVKLATNIEQDDAITTFKYPNVTGTIADTLKGGLPNIVAPYFKIFNLQYTDVYGRQATAINKNVAVTGILAETATFTTISPQIPLKVLHDPPGDNSSSFWETNRTSEQALRFYRANSSSTDLWSNIQIGTEFSTGLGVETENSVWGAIGTKLTVGSRASTETETILTTSTTQNFSTASNEEVTGSQGDVYIGAAVNLKYAKTQVISYKSDSCKLVRTVDFMIAPKGFQTQYIYSEGHIVGSIIPVLRDFAALPTNTLAQKNEYERQIRIWEQVVANNAANKKRAPFLQNYSFDGNAGSASYTSSSSSSKTSTVEFGLEINNELATELGFEVAGSGASGGIIINSKLETGESIANTSMASTTTGFTLDDSDEGDFFSVDVKRDPVYNTPVFELVAGRSSCPWEEGTQPRDGMQLTVNNGGSISGIAANGEAEFTLTLRNTSQSGETRTYSLAFDQASNPFGAVVTIGGSPVVVPISYTIGYLGSIQVTVKVARGASNIYSYTGLTFTLSDNCDGAISKSVALSAFFLNPCSNVTLSVPSNNWVVNGLSNIVPVVIKDYTIANLTSIDLEYTRIGTNSWNVAFSRLPNQLSPDASGTLVNWNVANLQDGTYNLRLKLNCGLSNVIYSPSVMGVIDRKPPVLFGAPEPTDDNFKIGDPIIASYTEKLGCDALNNNNVVVRNLKTNTIVAAQLGCFENRLSVVPLSTLGVAGDSVRVTLQNVQDFYGNVKTTADSWKFTIGTSVPATGNSALSLNSSNVPLGSSAPKNPSLPPSSQSVNISMNEDATGTLDFYFNLPANAPHDILINYTVSGSANPANDYTVFYYPINQPTSTRFNGTSGTITIKAGERTATLKIDPTADTRFEGNETVIVSIAEGGNYGIAANYTMTGTIINDDTDDCLNGGNVFQLTNNNAPTNTAIVAGTYHKAKLEATGTVEVPTQVNLKGAQYVEFKPGFEVKAGSVLRATIEGCPPAPSAVSMTLRTEASASNARLAASTAENAPTLLTATAPQYDVAFEPNVFAVVTQEKIDFEFKLDKPEEVTMVLLDNYGGEVRQLLNKVAFEEGTFTASIATEGLKKGHYFVKMNTHGKKTYQKVSIP